MGRISNIYKQLFEVNILHHYFLDDGMTAFDDNTGLQEAQLEKYDVREFMTILPSYETQNTFRNQKLVLNMTPTGFIVFVKVTETAPNSGIFEPAITLEQQQQLCFLLYVSDYLFENYSTVAPNPSLPFLFTNVKPATEGPAFPYMDVPATTTAVADYAMSPATFEAVSGRLGLKERTGLFATILLEMEGDDTVPVDGHPRNILEPDGSLPLDFTEFKIQIQNRSTVWNYLDALDGSLLHSSDPTQLPLVKNGIVGYSFDNEERPAAEPTRIVFEKDGGGNIVKTISEIYIN